MTRIVLATLILLPGASLRGQTSQRPANHQGLGVDFAKVKWTSVSPTDSTVQYSMLHVDSISGATQMLWRFPANAKGPCEWHGAGQGTAVIQGSIVVRHAGTAGTRLGVGGFSFVPKRMPFQVSTGPTPTIVFSTLDGRFDKHVARDAQCKAAEGSLPAQQQAVEIDFAKVAWTNFSAKDKTAQYSILHVDSISGSTQMLFRIPPNDTSPCHWHTPTESNVVVQGSAVMRHAGVTSGALGVGGFSLVPKRVPHQISTGPTLTIVFSSLDGRFDFNPVADDQCGLTKD